MAPTNEVRHLSNHHQETLDQIVRHPAGHNIEWRPVLSLLEFVASSYEERDGKVVVTLGGETETFERPAGKDISTQQVVDLRRMLQGAGYAGLE
jgi:hypothetical protein